MIVEPYARLSEVYDLDWGRWATRYVGLLGRVLAARGLGRARILDLGCGTGGLAAELAGLGHEVVGVDLSPEMIATARRREVPGTAFVVGDMASFEWPSPFDLLTCTFDAFNYLVTEDRVERFLAGSSRLLAPGGRLVFDSTTDALYGQRHRGVHDLLLGGRRIRAELRWDAATRRALTRFTFEDGATEEHVQHPWNPSELDRLLRERGLVAEGMFGDPEGSPWVEGGDRVVCLAGHGASR